MTSDTILINKLIELTDNSLIKWKSKRVSSWSDYAYQLTDIKSVFTATVGEEEILVIRTADLFGRKTYLYANKFLVYDGYTHGRSLVTKIKKMIGKNVVQTLSVHYDDPS